MLVTNTDTVAEVHGHVGRVVAIAGDPERHDRDRGGGRLALRRRCGHGRELYVRQPLGDARDAIHLRAHGLGPGALAAGEHGGELVALGTLEAGEVLAHHLRRRSGHLEPATGEMVGLLGGERQRGEQDQEPRRQHEPAPPLEEPCQPVHKRLHDPVRGDTRICATRL
jgi:hypothetical protein